MIEYQLDRHKKVYLCLKLSNLLHFSMSTVRATLLDPLYTVSSSQTMNLKSELSWEEVVTLVDKTVFNVTGKHLDNLETTVLRGSYEGKTYKEMSGIDYQTPTLQEAGAKLWDKLTKALKEDVKKTNFVQALKRYKEGQAALNNHSIHPPLKASQLQESQKANSSDFYIRRHNVDSLCEKTIEEPGALIRIKAPQRMGKTMLLNKLLEYASTKQNYKPAKLDLQLPDRKTLTDLKTLLQWLCFEVSNSLRLKCTVKEDWQDFLGDKTNCRNYFQDKLLPVIEKPLVLAIDNFDWLFEFRDIFSEFCSLLRVWHDEAKRGDEVGENWKKLRIVLVYSTEAYPKLDTNYSPFNVGVAIELPDFEESEVENLVKQYGLDEQFKENGLKRLMDLVGGHPDLIQQALISIKREQTTLEQLLELAPTELGIFSDYLRQQLWILKHSPKLESEYKKVVVANKSVKLSNVFEPVRLDSELAFKLYSMGLVNFSGNGCIPRYKLDSQYFSKYFE